MTRRVLFNSIFLLTIILLTGINSFAQNFSNKGREFWITFPVHTDQNQLGSQLNEQIIITSDKATSALIYINGGTTFYTVAVIAANVPFVL